MKHDVYLYGMTLLTSSHLLAGGFPALDDYAEIRESHLLPGGETGTAAVVLASLGSRVKIDGNHQGFNTYEPLMRFMGGIGVDASRLRLDEGFEGLQDLVIISGHDRTIFGKFRAYYADPVKRWSEPVPEDVESAAAVGLDPFFGAQSERVALLCRDLGKKYVTIDCRHDSLLNRHAEVNAVSHEFLRQKYPGVEPARLFELYARETEGLVVFTFGADSVLYGRRGQEPRTFSLTGWRRSARSGRETHSRPARYTPCGWGWGTGISYASRRPQPRWPAPIIPSRSIPPRWRKSKR